MDENKAYLKEQIITYIGNKRRLMSNIEEEIIKIQKEIKKEKTINVDLFSGSGIIARMMKKYSSKLIVNDLELYSRIINECYLSNTNEFKEEIFKDYREKIENRLEKKDYTKGIISENYAPKDDSSIKSGERVFYTTNNGHIIDTIRDEIEKIENKYKKYFLGPLLYEASVKTNTAGIFKGFYKDSKTGIGQYGGTGENALDRIKGLIRINKPIFSNFDCDYEIYQEDSNQLIRKIKNIDILYIDPPYNQHPYGSNYFMLNLIVNNKINCDISLVSGIPKNWNRSVYNHKDKALNNLEELINLADSKYIIVSYNSEGIIEYNDMVNMMKKYGNLFIKEIVYNTYRGSRNLSERNLYVIEYLFVLKKGGERK